MPSAEDWAKALAEQIVSLMDEVKASKARAMALGEQISRAQLEANTAKARAQALSDEVARATAEAQKAEATAAALTKETAQAEAEAQTAEAKAITLGEQLSKAQAEANAEMLANAETVAVYPAGRYECKGCAQSVMFTSPTSTLPICENCGSQEYKGHEPEMTKVMPTPGKRYHAGMYQCGSCGARVAVATDTDALPPCDFCEQTGLEPVK